METLISASAASHWGAATTNKQRKLKMSITQAVGIFAWSSYDRPAFCRKTQVLEPIDIPRAPNTGTGNNNFAGDDEQGELVLLKSKAERKWKREQGNNEAEWIGKVDIRKGEIAGSTRSMHGYILTSSRLKIESFW